MFQRHVFYLICSNWVIFIPWLCQVASQAVYSLHKSSTRDVSFNLYQICLLQIIWESTASIFSNWPFSSDKDYFQTLFEPQTPSLDSLSPSIEDMKPYSVSRSNHHSPFINDFFFFHMEPNWNLPHPHATRFIPSWLIVNMKSI